MVAPATARSSIAHDVVRRPAPVGEPREVATEDPDLLGSTRSAEPPCSIGACPRASSQWFWNPPTTPEGKPGHQDRLEVGALAFVYACEVRGTPSGYSTGSNIASSG